MCYKRPSDRKRRVCLSCGKPWVRHLGIQGECALLRDARSEIASLKAELELVSISYKAAHDEVIRLRRGKGQEVNNGL